MDFGPSIRDAAGGLLSCGFYLARFVERFVFTSSKTFVRFAVQKCLGYDATICGESPTPWSKGRDDSRAPHPAGRDRLWGQNLQLHPHLHCLVPGGGITQQGKWRRSKAQGKFLFPVKALSKVFRGKFCDGLIELEASGEIKLDTPFVPTRKYLHPFYKNRWVVFAKRPVRPGEKTLEYLGRYVHKVAIGNSRIKAIDDKYVTFSWFDYRTSKAREMTLDGQEFVRRWSMHILPEHFVKVRHYGICANRSKMAVRQMVYECLGKEPSLVQKGLKWAEVYLEVYGKSPYLCPACQKANMVTIQILPPIRDGPSRIKPYNPHVLQH